MDLESELLQIRIVQDQLEQQGYTLTSSDMYFTLYTAIQDVLHFKVGDGVQKVTPQMITVFNIPVMELRGGPMEIFFMRDNGAVGQGPMGAVERRWLTLQV